MSRELRRRRFLAATGSAIGPLLAGCLFSEPCGSKRVLELHLFPPGERDELVTQLSDVPMVGSELIREAHQSDRATINATADPPIPAKYVELDWAYHEVSVSARKKTTVEGKEVDVGMQHSRGSLDEEVVQLNDLPNHDRRAFLAGIGHPLEDRVGIEFNSEFTTEMKVGYVDASQRSSSIFFPGESDIRVDYIEYGGDYFSVDIGRNAAVTVTTYDVRSQAVATSKTELIPPTELSIDLDALERSSVDEARLSAAQWTMIEEAIEDRYSECTTISDDFEELIDHYLSPSDLRYDEDWNYVTTYVRYEEDWYRVKLFERQVGA